MFKYHIRSVIYFCFRLGNTRCRLCNCIIAGDSFFGGFNLYVVSVPFSVPFLPKRQEVVQILKLGIPSGLQMMVIFAEVTAIMAVVNSFGGAIVAGFGASQRIDSLITLPAMALGTAVNSMAGQNIGANGWDRVREIALFGSVYNFLIMMVIAIIFFLSAEILTTLFIQQEDAVVFGTDYLKIVVFFYPFIGLNFILNGIRTALH